MCGYTADCGQRLFIPFAIGQSYCRIIVFILKCNQTTWYYRTQCFYWVPCLWINCKTSWLNDRWRMCIVASQVKLGLQSDFSTSITLNEYRIERTWQFSYIWDSNSRLAATVRNLGKFPTWFHSGPVFFSSVKGVLIHLVMYIPLVHLVSKSIRKWQQNDTMNHFHLGLVIHDDFVPMT